MSCDFDIHCLDCGDSCGFRDLNWGGDDLLAVMEHRKELEVLTLFRNRRLVEQDFFYDAGRLGMVAHFFPHHIDHRIVVLSEYGQIYAGTCRGGGTRKGFCDLEKGHKGECHFPPKLAWDVVSNRYKEIE